MRTTTSTRSTLRRIRDIALLALLVVSLLPFALTGAHDLAAQSTPTREPGITVGIAPSPTPVPPRIDDIVANPTAVPTRVIDDLVANPTAVPTRAIDDVVANPTAVPTRVIDDLVANPTAVPTRAIDDIVANPTSVPTRVIDDLVANSTAVPSSVRVITRDCPLGVVENATLSDYLDICLAQHDGVEFSLSHAEGVEATVTVGGEAFWDDVPLGPFQIQETLPTGYTDPTVHCGFTESPGGGVQHPALQDAAGGTVNGSIEVQGSEYVCYWMNIKAIPAADLELEKTCPVIPFGAGFGDAIAYEITVTNTGTVPLFDIDIIETRDGTFDAPFPTELAPGEAATRIFTSEITLNDVIHGNVDNGVAATAQGDVLGAVTELTVELNVSCGLDPFGGLPDDVTD